MKHYGLIGYPLSHSFSPAYFNERFRKEAIEATYTAYPLESIDAFPELVQQERLSGLNVTIPYKEAILPFLHQLDPHAAAIGAVNCMAFRNGRLTGYNTDWLGFRNSLVNRLNPLPVGALVLGTGGAAKAVVYALTQLQVPYRMVSRTFRNGGLVYEQLDPTVLAQYPLLINTTPLGTWPDVAARPPVPYELLTPRNALYDLVYNPEETAFLRSGREQGCAIKNGLQMLHEQANESWNIWQAFPGETGHSDLF
ncbi:MAG: shikimate dehydrogenase [Sphingobacteriales bacterium]|nr:MAG: shikimate dehydrogenase [Sphingobacteriales bacterium]